MTEKTEELEKLRKQLTSVEWEQRCCDFSIELLRETTVSFDRAPMASEVKNYHEKLKRMIASVKADLIEKMKKIEEELSGELV